MKKLLILMLLLTISVIASAQKMTIKTGNGQTVEISCDGGLSPKEIAVAPDGTVTFKLGGDSAQVKNAAQPIVEEFVEESDSVDTFVEITDSLTTDSLHEEMLADEYMADSLVAYTGQQTLIGALANSLAKELSPEYAQFEEQYGNTKMASEKDVVKSVAKQFIDEDVVETVDFFGTLFGSFRLTKDTSFVASYAQRKPKPSWRSFNTIKLSGSLGKDIASVGDIVANQVKEEDYGDDAKNHNKYGGDIEFSRAYMHGTVVDSIWKPNPIGFAWSWGGLVSYSYEQDIGSYLSLMGKAGIQIGHDICIGIDGLFGVGIAPYNTFLTNEIDYNIVNKSIWCFKYGVQGWASLNFSRDTYTAIFARYINSIRPNSSQYELSDDWEVVLEDFDPLSWTVGLAVGYKFGAPEPLSQNKRLQFGLKTGYYLIGDARIMSAGEIERLTQVSKSTTLSYGLALENTFIKGSDGDNCSALLFSTGFTVKQPYNSWFWGAKLYAGAGEYPVVNYGYADDYTVADHSKKLCGKAALEFSTGFRIGKLSNVFASLRAGGHLGKAQNFENFDERSYTSNLSGFDLMGAIGYNIIF